MISERVGGEADAQSFAATLIRFRDSEERGKRGQTEPEGTGHPGSTEMFIEANGNFES
jgi:hypothetical protein